MTCKNNDSKKKIVCNVAERPAHPVAPLFLGDPREDAHLAHEVLLLDGDGRSPVRASPAEPFPV